MAEEIAFENGRISNFEGLVTLTLTLDRIILHTVMHHTSTSTYMPNFIEIEETLVDRQYVRTYVSFIRSTLSNSRPKKILKELTYIWQLQHLKHPTLNYRHL